MLGIMGMHLTVLLSWTALCEVAFNSIKLVLIKAILTCFGIEISHNVILRLTIHVSYLNILEIYMYS